MSSKDVMKSQRRKKLHAIESFGGKCQICGYDKCPNALEFHHLDGKEENPSYVIMRWSWERAKKELDKCILVCANCHREIHYKFLDYDLIRHLRKWIKKKCKVCDTDFESKIIEQECCSISCKQIADRKVERPTKEDLGKFISDGVPFVKLGKMFGVSDNAVRKWARRYDIAW